jgi:hypothetical protein
MRDTAIILAACIAIVVGAALPSPSAPTAAVIDGPPTASIAVSHLPQGDVVTVDAIPREPPLRTFFEYDDPRYVRGRGMSDRFADGLTVHLKAALAYRGVDATVSRVDAAGLRAVLERSASGVCVVVPGGILPSTVRRVGVDELHSFLTRGGTVIWAGAPFDLYYSMEGALDAPPSLSHADPSSWPRLYARTGPLDARDVLSSPPLRYGAIVAQLDRATGLTFDATTFHVDARRLLAIGGSPLAYVDESGDSSVSELPIGRGRVVIFGDAFPDELDAARQIAQTVATGAWFAPRRIRVVATLGPATPTKSIEVPSGTRLFAFGEPPFYFPFGH